MDRQEVETVALFHPQRLRLQAFLLQGFLLHRFLGAEWLGMANVQLGWGNPIHQNTRMWVIVYQLFKRPDPGSGDDGDLLLLKDSSLRLCIFFYLWRCWYWCFTVQISAARFRQSCSHVTHIHLSVGLRSEKSQGCRHGWLPIAYNASPSASIWRPNGWAAGPTSRCVWQMKRVQPQGWMIREWWEWINWTWGWWKELYLGQVDANK